VLLAVQILIPLFSLTVPNLVVFFKLLVRKFNSGSKNVLKTVICTLQVSVTIDFVPDCLFKQCFRNCSVLDMKFNKDSKNVLKTVILSLQVGFTSDFVLKNRLQWVKIGLKWTNLSRLWIRQPNQNLGLACKAWF